MLSDNPTKAQELAHWRTFLATLPPCSYLALYLHGSDALLEDAMRQDASTELIPAMRRTRDEARAQEAEAVQALRAAQAQRDAMRREVDALKRAAVQVRTELHDAARTLQTLAAQAVSAHARAVDCVLR